MTAVEIVGVLRLRDEMTAALRPIRANLGDVRAELHTLERQLRTTGESMRSVGTALTAGLTVPIAGASTAALHLSGQFEATTTKLTSLAGVTATDLQRVREHILQLAPAVGIGPAALADAMTIVSSTVSDTTVAMEILDIAAKGSAAGMGETKDIARALTAVINSYGAENISAARAGDILTQAVKDGGAEAKELAPTLANVVPMAAQLGISFEEVAANIATFTRLGVPASEAVTSLSGVMTALLKPTEEGKDALAAIGLTYEQLRAQVADGGLMSALQTLNTRFGDNKTALADVFGRVEALRNMMGTAGQQAETYAEVLDRVTKSAGTLDGAFDAMMGTQVQTWGQFWAQVQVLAIQFGDALVPALKSVLQAAKPVLEFAISAVEWFTKLPSPVQTTVIGIGALAAALGPIVFTLGGLASSIGSVMAIAAPFGGVLAVLASGPVAAIAIGIIGVVTAITNFKNSMNDLEDKAKQSRAFSEKAKEAEEMTRQAKAAAAAAGPLHAGMQITIDLSKGLNRERKAAAPIIAAVSAGERGLSADYKAQQEALEEIKKAREEIRLAQIPLTAAQQAEARALFELGVSHKAIAADIGASTIQVKLFEQGLKDADEALEDSIANSRELGRETAAAVNRMMGGQTVLRDLAVAMGDLQGGIGSIYSQIGLLTGRVTTELFSPAIQGGKGIVQTTFEADDALNQLADTFVRLGQASGGSLGSILSGVGQMIVMLQAAREQAALMGRDPVTGQPVALGGNFGYLSTVFNPRATSAQRWSAGIASATAISQGAMNVWSATQSRGSMWGNAGAGALAGAQAGAVGGAWGVAIGAAAGLIVGIIRGKPEWAKAADEIGRDFGVKIGEELARAVAETAKGVEITGGSEGYRKMMQREVASFMHLSDIIAAGGGLDADNLGTFTSQLPTMFQDVKAGVMKAKDAAKVLDETWQQFVEAGTDAVSGRLNPALVETIKLMAKAGVESKAVKAYLQEQASVAIAGANAAIGFLTPQFGYWQQLSDSIKEATRAGDDWMKSHIDGRRSLADMQAEQAGLAQQMKGQLEDLAVIAVASFGAAMASGASFTEALRAAGPGLDQLKVAFENLGLSSDNVLFSTLAFQSTIMKENPHLMTAIGGLADGMVALSNMGMLNVDTFAAMQRTGMEMYVRLQAAVAAHGGSTKDALLPMQEYLHRAAEQAELLGIPLDENTQMLINQSKELGIWKEKGKSASDLILDGMKDLVASVKDLIGQLRSIPNIAYTVTEHRRYTYENPEPGDPNIPPPIPMAGGGFWQVSRPTLFLAGEAGSEEVAFSGAGRHLSRGGSGGNAETNQLLRRLVDRLAFVDTLSDDLTRSLTTALQQHG